MDVRFWAVVVKQPASCRPYIRFRKRGGLGFTAGILRWDLEVVLTKTHGPFSHSVNDGRDCCYSKPRPVVTMPFEPITDYEAEEIRQRWITMWRGKVSS